MLDIAKDGGVERFDDLHIDKIDENWKPRELWIEAGIQAFRIALDLRKGYELPFVVSLAFSMEDGNQRGGVDFQTQARLQQQLDHTPPSLYLFERGKEPWVEMERAIGEGVVATDAIVQNLDSVLLDCPALEGNWFYLEFKRPHLAEYNRSLFVAG